MNRQIQRMGVVVLVLFGALFVNLNVISLLQADELANHPANRRVIIREYAIERGPIVVGEEAIARSLRTEEGQYRYLRRYAEPELYAHITGYYSIVLQRSGLERALNDELTGRTTEVVAQNLGELLGGSQRPGNAVELTLDPAVQRAARDALGGREGAVVVLDPRNGAVLASYANPTFDPNPLSSHDTREINEAWAPLRDAPDRPLVDRATGELYPPGSTFKVIVAAAALEAGSDPSRTFPNETTFDVPQTTQDISNFGGARCGDGDDATLQTAFRRSCNTVFARLGIELGDQTLADQAEAFGFNRAPPLELPAAASAIPREQDVPATAQSAIGQRDVQASVLQMAMVAATVANGGQLLRPHLVATVRDPDGRIVRGADIGRWETPPGDGRPISPRTAQQLRALMVDAVEGPGATGGAARIDGVEVGGKTGTAQTAPGAPSVSWFIGFAGDEVAIAVAVPGAEGTGTAVPIARQVLAAAIAGAR
ncbi:MAG: peptidoglycan D,D-transpeptidase FtsI family protein [Nitriliruptoraceae bacterium]